MQYFGFDRTLGQMRTFGFAVEVFEMAEGLPTELFKNNEQGAFYLPEPENLFQDAAMTIPVTANGDPVGAMIDLSGNGNHATQTVSASRPTYQTDGILHWLQGDGVDDIISTPLSLSQPLTRVVGAFILSFDHADRLLGGSDSYLAMSKTNRLGMFYGKSLFSQDGELQINDSMVVTEDMNGASSSVQFGNTKVEGDAGNNPITNLTLFGQNSGSNSNIKMYGLIVVGNTLTSVDKANLQKYLAQKSGVTL